MDKNHPLKHIEEEIESKYPKWEWNVHMPLYSVGIDPYRTDDTSLGECKVFKREPPKDEASSTMKYMEKVIEDYIKSEEGEPYFDQQLLEEMMQFYPCNDVVEEKEISVEQATSILCKALKEDDRLYYGYHANIAMAFYDAFNNSLLEKQLEEHKRELTVDYISSDIIQVANKAARNFLNQLIGE